MKTTTYRDDGRTLRVKGRPLPVWERNLIFRVCRRERIRTPGVTYSAGSGSGRAYSWPHSIVLRSFGMSKPYQRYLVLHELAHLIAPLGAGHSQEFVDVLWRIARAEGATADVRAHTRTPKSRLRMARALDLRERAA